MVGGNCSLFKKPNAKSREALNSKKIKIGSHEVTFKRELKDKAFPNSYYLCLDEVQSYILVERSLERDDLAVDFMVELKTIFMWYCLCTTLSDNAAEAPEELSCMLCMLELAPEKKM